MLHRGCNTCRNPLGSFSLRTSRQYSIMPVVCRSFMVQCVIWSRTIWSEWKTEVNQNRHGIKRLRSSAGRCCVCRELFHGSVSPRKSDFICKFTHKQEQNYIWLEVTTSWWKGRKAQSTVTVLLDCMFTLLTPTLHFKSFLVYRVL